MAGSGYGQSYFEQIRTEWSLVPDAEKALPPAASERLAEILAKRSEELTWSDVYAFERLLTRALPAARLKPLATAVRSEYRELVGSETFCEYEKAHPLPVEGSDEATLRADVEQLQSDMQWIYIIQPLEEFSRNRLTKWLIVMMLLLSVAVIFWAQLADPGYHTLSYVVFAGALGAAFSAQRRIQTAAGQRSSLVNLMKSGSVRLSVQIAPVIGGLSAVVLAFLFAAGLLQGALFPAVSVATSGESVALCSALKFAGAADPNFAKLLVWSFVAGFAERLIPDALDRLTAQAKQSASAPAPTPAGGAISGAAVGGAPAGGAPRDTAPRPAMSGAGAQPVGAAAANR